MEEKINEMLERLHVAMEQGDNRAKEAIEREMKALLDS